MTPNLLLAFFVCTCRNGCPRCHPDACDFCDELRLDVSFDPDWDAMLCDECTEAQRKPFSVRLDELQL